MDEQEWLQELELADSVVSASRGLLSFFTENSNAYMSLENHGAVVGAITNRESSFIWEPLSNQVYNLSLLFRRDPAS